MSSITLAADGKQWIFHLFGLFATTPGLPQGMRFYAMLTRLSRGLAAQKKVDIHDFDIYDILSVVEGQLEGSPCTRQGCFCRPR